MWHNLVIPALGRLGQEDHQLEAKLCYTVRFFSQYPRPSKKRRHKMTRMIMKL